MLQQRQLKTEVPQQMMIPNVQCTCPCVQEYRFINRRASVSSAKLQLGPAQRLFKRGKTAPEVQANAKESPCNSLGSIYPTRTPEGHFQTQKMLPLPASLWFQQPCSAHLFCTGLSSGFVRSTSHQKGRTTRSHRILRRPGL